MPPRRLGELAKYGMSADASLIRRHGDARRLATLLATVVSRAELRAALVLVNENVPLADAADPDDWRAELLGRYSTVPGFVKLLPSVICFGATPRAAACPRR